MHLAPGARVRIRDEEWLVRQTRPSTRGYAVHVTGLSELVKDKDAVFLTALDAVEELRPEDTALVHDDSPKYRRARLYLDTLLRRTPPTDARLYVGHRAAMRASHYQLVPAALALSRPRPRILIADAVGLGKTIEVGVLLSELIRRGRGDRILVVALKSVLAQFQEELWARFTIPLVRLDSVGIQRVRSRIPSNMNPFYFYDRCIISIDTLKRDEKYRRYLEQSRWDAIVIDECQHVAVRGRSHTHAGMSQRARLAKLLADTTDALIMTSATPHDGRPESFASLMNLLEPTAVADPANYTKEDIRGLYVRRFKKDIAHEAGTAFHKRDLATFTIAASPAENAAFEALQAARFHTIDRKRSGTDILFRTVLLKALLSSPAAARSTCEHRISKLHKRLERDPESADIPHDIAELEKLVAALDAVGSDHFGKLQKLFGLLEEIGWKGRRQGERVVIFSERIDTLKLLQAQITERFGLDEEAVPIFFGTQSDQEQQALVKDFGTEKGKVRILLGSDAASEGINLHHYCHWLLHFDIPWSLITLEQRNGRIDRFGQSHAPMIRYFLTEPAHPEIQGDLRVLDRLIEKEKAAHENLGDVAWLMNLHDASEEEKRVALGIQGHEAAEAIIPESPTASFFAGLSAMAAAPAGSAPELPVEDSLDGNLGDDVRVEPAPTLSLFDSDLAYAREAFQELHDQDAEVRLPEWQDHLKGFVLSAPDDLKRRYDHLPPALTQDGWHLKLTADRELVQRSYEQSREDEGRWPEWQLFWDMHPVSEWLNDRVLVLLARHEAAVIRLSRGLEPGQTVYVFQGQLSNKRSQPVLVDWFGVVVSSSGAVEVKGLRELIELCGLDGELPNPGPLETLEPMKQGLAGAVQHAKRYMSEQRKARAGELMGELKEEFTRVKHWRRKALQRVDADETRITARRTLRSDEKKRLERRREDIMRRSQALTDWVQQGLSTVDEPYIRLALVLSRDG